MNAEFPTESDNNDNVDDDSDVAPATDSVHSKPAPPDDDDLVAGTSSFGRPLRWVLPRHRS